MRTTQKKTAAAGAALSDDGMDLMGVPVKPVPLT